MWSSLLLLGAGPAHAIDYNVRICAQYVTDYVDAALSAEGCGTEDAEPACDLDDDYFRNNGVNKPARGAWLIWKNSIGLTVWEGYTEWADPDAGCTPTKTVTSTNGPWTVRILSLASVNGNYIGVRNNDVDQAHYQSVVVDPGITGSGDYTVAFGPHQAWNTAAAVGWAITRRNAGVSGNNTWTFFMCGCPEYGTSCTDPGTGTGNCHKANSDWTYIFDDMYKSYIAHEFGHQLAEERDAGLNPPGAGSVADPGDSYSTLPPGLDVDCPDTATAPHSPPSAELQSVAIWEGLANYYAGTTWNVTTQDDCELLWSYSIDWTGDTVGDSSLPWSCGGSPDYDPTLADHAHYETYCRDHGPDLLNRSTELDWTRLFRDLDRYEGLDTTDVYDIYDEANPRDWDWDVDGGDPDDYPQERVDDAAVFLGWSTAWNAVPNGHYWNGTWR